jgi:hypothetical protein
MALGMTPIIPLNQVLPNPEARFQRFGLNDSKLVGTPVVQLASSRASAAPELPAVRRASTPLSGPADEIGNPSAAETRAVDAGPSRTAGYTVLGTLQVGGSTPGPGMHLNLKA